jgi:repressor LexA
VAEVLAEDRIVGRKPLLTKNKVLVAIQRLTAKRGEEPSVEDLRRELNVASTRTVYRFLHVLEEEGAISRRPGAAGIKLLKPAPGLQTRAVGILGRVPAGAPMLADELFEGWVRLPKSLVPASDSFFLLRVRGTSMNRAEVDGENIEDGDLILVRQQSAARPNDIVVASVDGEATVKRFVKAPDYYILKPESSESRHRPIVVEREFRILGKVKAVFKRGSELLERVFDAGS